MKISYFIMYLILEMMDLWTYRWLLPQRSGTKKDDRIAGPNLGDFSSQSGGRAVLGNSVGKEREEGSYRAPGLPALQVYSDSERK